MRRDDLVLPGEDLLQERHGAKASIASIGTAGVPGVGTVMLAMVLRQMELPVEGIGLILGVDRLLDVLQGS